MSPHITRLKHLKALILNHNNLLEIENIEPLLELNTLGNIFICITYAQILTCFYIVISHNKVDRVPRLSSLLQLTKLSAAHNQLTEVPDLTHNVLLKEIRLNDNKITQIPETLRKCNAIEIMDFGNNNLTNWADIAAFGSLTKLHNLNLKGNPITKKKDYLEKVNICVYDLKLFRRKKKLTFMRNLDS